MPAEPSQQDQDERAEATLVHRRSGGTSPVRWLLVLVPVLIAAIGGAYLAASWLTSMQQAERPSAQQEQRAGKAQPADDTSARSAASFDARAVLRLLAKANPEDGAQLFRMCSPCHSAEKNGPARIGSNLWGVVGQPIAAQPGFNYSAALKARRGTWSYAELAAYIHNPRVFVPGTSMAFAGIEDEMRIANVIAYMRTRSDNPMPLPR